MTTTFDRAALKKWRANRTYNTVAGKIGCTTEAYIKWEFGGETPSEPWAKRIADVIQSGKPEKRTPASDHFRDATKTRARRPLWE